MKAGAKERRRPESPTPYRQDRLFASPQPAERILPPGNRRRLQRAPGADPSLRLRGPPPLAPALRQPPEGREREPRPAGALLGLARSMRVRRHGPVDRSDGIEHHYRLRRGEALPAREHFLVAGPAGAADKALPSFEPWWNDRPRAADRRLTECDQRWRGRLPPRTVRASSAGPRLATGPGRAVATTGVAPTVRSVPSGATAGKSDRAPRRQSGRSGGSATLPRLLLSIPIPTCTVPGSDRSGRARPAPGGRRRRSGIGEWRRPFARRVGHGGNA